MLGSAVVTEDREQQPEVCAIGGVVTGDVTFCSLPACQEDSHVGTINGAVTVEVAKTATVAAELFDEEVVDSTFCDRVIGAVGADEPNLYSRVGCYEVRAVERVVGPARGSAIDSQGSYPAATIGDLHCHEVLLKSIAARIIAAVPESEGDPCITLRKVEVGRGECDRAAIEVIGGSRAAFNALGSDPAHRSAGGVVLAWSVGKPGTGGTNRIDQFPLTVAHSCIGIS